MRQTIEANPMEGLACCIRQEDRVEGGRRIMLNTRKYIVVWCRCAWALTRSELASAVRHIEEAARLGANIVCLPELFRTQYFCQREIFGCSICRGDSGPSTQRLPKSAQGMCCDHRFSVRAPCAGLYHNTAATLNSDGPSPAFIARCTSRTIRCTTKSITLRRGSGFQAVDTAFGRVGTLVCWDQWYPEGAGSPLCRREVLFYPTAIGWHPAEKTVWRGAI